MNRLAGWGGAAVVALAAALSVPSGCSSTSSDCCSGTVNGSSLCLCGTLSQDGASCTASGTSASCSIACVMGTESIQIDGTPVAKCESSTSDFGGDAGGECFGSSCSVTINAPDSGSGFSDCGFAGEPCCTSGTICMDGCCDPSANTCVLDGEECSGGTAFCSGSACVTCGGAGQPCCEGDGCNGSGCCDVTANPEVCVASGAACGSAADDQVCSGGACQACGTAGGPCCPGNTCTGDGLECSTLAGDATCD